jgi:hypothetical protein
MDPGKIQPDVQSRQKIPRWTFRLPSFYLSERDIMTQDFDFMTRSTELFRKVSCAMLAGSEQLVVANLDSVQALVSRSSQQLRAVIADARSIETPKQASAVERAGVCIPLELTREVMLSTAACQVACVHRLQQQAAEAHQLFNDAFDTPMAALQETGSRQKKTYRAFAVSLRQAA